MGKKAEGFWKPRGSRFWHTRDPLTGKRGSTRCRDIGAAVLWRSSRERARIDPAHEARANATVGFWCGRLVAMRRDAGKQTKFYEQKLGHWVRIFGADCSLVEIDPPAFDQFVAQRRSEGASDHTISKEVGAFLRALRLAKRASAYASELDALRPFDLSPGYVPRTRALSPEEFAALFVTIGGKPRYDNPEQRQAFVAFAVGLGLRKGEIEKLQPDDFDLERGVVHIRGTKTKGSDRWIPILPPFRKLIEWAHQFLPLKPWGLAHRDLRAACRAAKIPDCTANDLRRTHATLLRTAGVDRDAVRRLLGHSVGSKMLETVYDQPSPHELAQRAGDLGALSSKLAIVGGEKAERAREDSNFRPTAPEAASETAQLGVQNENAELATTGGPGSGTNAAGGRAVPSKVELAEAAVFRAKSRLGIARAVDALERVQFRLKSRGWFRRAA